MDSYEVAGEFAHRENVAQIFADRGIRLGLDGNVLHLHAELVADRSNPYDGQAVAVFVDGLHIGHLEREEAARFFPVVSGLARHGFTIITSARLWSLIDGTVRARLTVDLPDPENLIAENDAPTVPHVVVPRGAAIKVSRTSEFHEGAVAFFGRGAGATYTATLHAIHDVRPRSSVEAVQVQIDGKVVGVLTPAQSANMLPLVKHIEARGKVPVVRARVAGSPIKVDITVFAIKSQEADPTWLDSMGPIVPRVTTPSRADYEWDD